MHFVGYLYIVDFISARMMEHTKIIHTNLTVDLRNISENFDNIRDSFPPCAQVANIRDRTKEYGVRCAFRVEAFVS